MKSPVLCIGLIGPLPPPSGGMANQTRQLAMLLQQDGIKVELVQTNAAYRPHWIARFKGLRALVRLIFYIVSLWRVAGRVQLFHVMANSGWSWHLFAAPAIWVAKLRSIPVVINYRGGGAEQFFSSSYFWVRPSLQCADEIIVPSAFLQEVFAKRNVTARIVPNIIDLQRFSPDTVAQQGDVEVPPHIIVTRNLEPIYDIATALCAFQKVKQKIAAARLTIAGSGPERGNLKALADHLGVADAVSFIGRLDNEDMAALYRSAAVMVNPSLVDNMPISILESWASGVPVVSTCVGGVPYLVKDGKNGLLIPAEEPDLMASAIVQLLADRGLAKQLAEEGLAAVQQYSWLSVKEKLLDVYSGLLSYKLPAADDICKAPVVRSWYTLVCSRCLFPLQERLKSHQTVAVRRHMEETQWWSVEHVQALQLNKLRCLLASASRQVPYYQKLFNEIGFEADKFSSVDDLHRLPFLTKSIIRAHLEDLRSDAASDLARFNTGGSSGEPLIFYIGKERVSHDVAAKWRATRWWGVDIGDPEIVVWGSPIELGTQDALRVIRDKLFRTKLLPAFEMSEQKLNGFLHEIRTMRPKMLFGYPSALAHIARHAQAKGMRMDDLGIKVAFVTSERLYDDQRKQIELIFGCRVANGYGGRDAGFIAHECPAGGMHITAEDIIVEIVDEQGVPLPPGSSGEVVVTHLATSDFPFIRYRTGDIAILNDKACSCGRGLPLIQEIQGRTTDFIVASDGTLMHGLALIYVVRDLPGVQQFKIIQENLHATRILLVTDATFKDTLIATIKSDVMRRLGADVRVDVEIVTHIAKESSGKYRYVISHVSSPEIQKRIQTR